MAVGGWDSFAAIEPYLNAPSEDIVNDVFAEVKLRPTTMIAPAHGVNGQEWLPE